MPSKIPIDISAPPKTAKDISEVDKLKRRAKKAAAAARASVPLSLRIPLPLYKALVELAEEYHQPISEIAKQCLTDGTRKYRDFQTARPAAFVNASPLVARNYPQPQAQGDIIARLQANARSSRPVLPHSSHQAVTPTQEEMDTAVTESIFEGLAGIPAGALMPFGGRPPGPVSANAEEEDPDALA
jgi:predicted transcriptional regulator